MKLLAILCVTLFTHAANAGPIILDPDDFATGTDLSNVSPHVAIRDLAGGQVIAKELTPDAADGYDTRGLGKNVFGGEWMYSIEGASGMEIEFAKPVIYFSLLVAELFPDAGPGSDPVLALIYDSFGNLLSEFNVNEYNKRVDLGIIKGSDPIFNSTWAYWACEFNAKDIKKIIIAGNSEPTTFDRLEFAYAETPESNTTLLFLMFIAFYLIKFIKISANIKQSSETP